MTTLYVPLHLPVVQAQRFLERELRNRDVDSVHVRGNALVIDHYPRSIFEMTAQDMTDYYGLWDASDVV